MPNNSRSRIIENEEILGKSQNWAHTKPGNPEYSLSPRKNISDGPGAVARPPKKDSKKSKTWIVYKESQFRIYQGQNQKGSPFA